MTSSPRIIVIGAGVGGLTAAALLAQVGYAVTVLEAQTYPGGCASTYYHKGFRFDSGATVAGGFQPNGPHALVGQMLDIQWPVQRHEPAWVVHLPQNTIALTADNQDVLHNFPQSAHFWDEQSRIADLCWSLSAYGLPWPPGDLAEAAQLVRAGLAFFPRDLRLAPFAFAPVAQWLRWRGLARDKAFVRFIDAQLLIAAQTISPRVNALYGATALDLARQGVYHVQGGIGGLAQTLVAKLRALGGEILYRQTVTRIAVENGQVTGVYTRHGKHARKEEFFPCDFLLANTTPWSLDTLLGEDSPRALRREVQTRADGAGAFVLHLGVEADKLPPNLPDHHQIIASLDGPLGEGRSIFISISPTWDTARAPAGQRAVTVSTHTEIRQWWQLLQTDSAAYYARKAEYTERMLTMIERALPGFRRSITLTLPGTPVTYQHYTGRHLGMVGGFPQTSLFAVRGPRVGLVNLRLVGDSIFPGQSTAGVTLGALRVVRDVRRHLDERIIKISVRENTLMETP
ncbi:MAG: FAD-dependent oxidoreductase [Chloroflexi bacterium]|nr:FAD-dependent oxidoreductase [Chloroflexota bacterium]